MVSIVILGKACDLIETHQESKKSSVSSPVKSCPPPSNVGNNDSKTNGEVINSSLNNTTDTSMVSTSIFKDDPVESMKNMSTEDMSLLEAKLQTIDPNLRVIPSSSPMTSPASAAATASPEADNLDPIKEEEQSKELENHHQHHRWSNNRRSQLLKQHQGELNKVVFSDSRRRPLSCTPPASTSISTSVSIDEDHEENKDSEQANNAKMIINKDDDEEEDVIEELTSMRPKALSSPDFMKSYKPAYDAERDWPPIDDDEDDVDSSADYNQDLEHEMSSNSRRGSNELMQQRRGSSEDRFRRRKRFDTDRV